MEDIIARSNEVAIFSRVDKLLLDKGFNPIKLAEITTAANPVLKSGLATFPD